MIGQQMVVDIFHKCNEIYLYNVCGVCVCFVCVCMAIIFFCFSFLFSFLFHCYMNMVIIADYWNVKCFSSWSVYATILFFEDYYIKHYLKNIREWNQRNSPKLDQLKQLWRSELTWSNRISLTRGYERSNIITWK